MLIVDLIKWKENLVFQTKNLIFDNGFLDENKLVNYDQNKVPKTLQRSLGNVSNQWVD